MKPLLGLYELVQLEIIKKIIEMFSMMNSWNI